MLWPIVLPAQITLAIMTTFVVAATIVAALLRTKPGIVFWFCSAIAFVAFIPSCAGLMSVLDSRRFGVFRYASYKDVQDFRIERYLPPAATRITLEKTPTGHRAKYTIPEADLRAYLNQLWTAYGKASAVSRDELSDGTPATAEEMRTEFDGLGWPPLQNALKYHSPVEPDGGGATYYVDPTTNTVCHRAGYW